MAILFKHRYVLTARIDLVYFTWLLHGLDALASVSDAETGAEILLVPLKVFSVFQSSVYTGQPLAPLPHSELSFCMEANAVGTNFAKAGVVLLMTGQFYYDNYARKLVTLLTCIFRQI